MPYISGNMYNFESRFHQFAWTEPIFSGFMIEKKSYSGVEFLQNRWDKEEDKKRWCLDLTGIY